jgi:hypothetical protein
MLLPPFLDIGCIFFFERSQNIRYIAISIQVYPSMQKPCRMQHPGLEQPNDCLESGEFFSKTLSLHLGILLAPDTLD